jgi:hypothetical protein
MKLSSNEINVIKRMREGYEIKMLYPTSKWVTFKGDYYNRIDEQIHHWATIDSLFKKGLFYGSRLTDLAKQIEL